MEMPVDPLTLDILIPTRERPENMKAVLRSIRDTASDPKRITVAFYIDNDDAASMAVPGSLDVTEYCAPFKEIQFLHGPRGGLAGVYNLMTSYVNGDILMYAADDIEFRTKGWDLVVREAFWESVDRIWLMWGYDPAREAAPFPDHGFISRWGQRVVKYLFPTFGPHPKFPGSLPCSFTDVWLQPMYNMIDRTRYLPHIEIAHKHWCTRTDSAEGTLEIDRNYATHAVLGNWRRTLAMDARAAEIPQHADKLLKWIRFVEKERAWLVERGWAKEIPASCERSTAKAATAGSSSTPSARRSRTRKSSGRTTPKARARKRPTGSSAG